MNNNFIFFLYERGKYVICSSKSSKWGSSTFVRVSNKLADKNFRRRINSINMRKAKFILYDYKFEFHWCNVAVLCGCLTVDSNTCWPPPVLSQMGPALSHQLSNNRIQVRYCITHLDKNSLYTLFQLELSVHLISLL